MCEWEKKGYGTNGVVAAIDGGTGTGMKGDREN